MTINERIKELRGALGLSQTEFGSKIGLKQSSLGQIETGVRNVTDRAILLICQSYGANEDWLRDGTGEMFKRDAASMVDQFAHEYNLDDIDRAIIERYMKLGPVQRGVIKDYIKSLTAAFADKVDAPAPAAGDTALAAIAAMQDYAQMVADEKEGGEKSSTSAG